MQWKASYTHYQCAMFKLQLPQAAPTLTYTIAIKLHLMITNLFGTMFNQVLHHITVTIFGCLIHWSEL